MTTTAGMTRAQAIEKVCEQHPSLYAQYRDAAEDAPVTKVERATVLHVAQQTVKKEIERVMKARGLARDAAAIAIVKEAPELIALTKDPRSSSRMVDPVAIEKSAAWLQKNLDLPAGKALIRALEYDALPPPIVSVASTSSVQKHTDTTDEKIEKAIKICEDVLGYLEKDWGVPRRPPVRKFNRAMTFNEIRALDRSAAA